MTVDFSQRIIHNILRCKYCLDQDIVECWQSGDIVCGMCGLVLEDQIIDPGMECRVFDADDCSQLRVEYNHDLSTYFSHKQFSKSINKKMSERCNVQLLEAFHEIDNCSRQMNLNEAIKKRVKDVYNQYVKNQTLKKRQYSIKEIVAALIAVVCKEAGVSRTFKEICQILRVNKKLVGQAYMNCIKPTLNITLSREHLNTSASQLIPRLIQHLKLPFTIERQTIQLITFIEKQQLFLGRQADILAAIAIFIITNISKDNKLHQTFDIIGVATKLDKYNLKNVYQKEFLIHQDLLVKELKNICDLPDLNFLPNEKKYTHRQIQNSTSVD